MATFVWNHKAQTISISIRVSKAALVIAFNIKSKLDI